MKYSIRAFVVFTAILLLSSCGSTHYQMAFFESELPVNTAGEYVQEDDTVEISYAFNSHNTSLKMAVYNPASQPMYINWQQSSLIENELSNPISTYFAGQACTRTNDNLVEIIPPQAIVYIEIPLAATVMFSTSNYTNYERLEYQTSQNLLKKTDQYTFDPIDRKRTMRLYLTFSDAYGNALFTREPVFWQGHLYETKVKQDFLQLSGTNPYAPQLEQPQNMVYQSNHEPGSGGAILLIVVVCGIIAGNM